MSSNGFNGVLVCNPSKEKNGITGRGCNDGILLAFKGERARKLQCLSKL